MNPREEAAMTLFYTSPASTAETAAGRVRMWSELTDAERDHWRAHTPECVFAPEPEPWTCTTHPGGFRTSSDETSCRRGRTGLAPEEEATPDGAQDWPSILAWWQDLAIQQGIRAERAEASHARHGRSRRAILRRLEAACTSVLEEAGKEAKRTCRWCHVWDGIDHDERCPLTIARGWVGPTRSDRDLRTETSDELQARAEAQSAAREDRTGGDWEAYKDAFPAGKNIRES